MTNHIYRDFDAMAGWWPQKKEGLGRIVFTNGCFDLLHAGHVSYLEEARALGNFLVLGLNSDSSVARLKGPTRPLNPFEARALVLRGLRSVDLVVGFEEDTPLNLIRSIQPDTLVKGGDWTVDQIVGGQDVLSRGGTVRSLSFKPGVSTTDLVALVLERYGKS